MQTLQNNLDAHSEPNLLIAGCQKSGTTWLHGVLSKSPKVFGSKVKELNYFNKPDRQSFREQYLRNFPTQMGAKYYLESTPHYFQAPDGHNDTAKNIQDELGSPKIIVIFRNPIDRYESAYIHHMMQRRIPYSKYINQLTDREKMLSLGMYSGIADHWSSLFPNIKYMLYDDLVANPKSFAVEIFNYLELDYDLSDTDLNFRTNDKKHKIRELNLQWEEMPRLTKSLKERLTEYYDDEIKKLEKVLDTDLSEWRNSANRRRVNS